VSDVFVFPTLLPLILLPLTLLPQSLISLDAGLLVEANTGTIDGSVNLDSENVMRWVGVCDFVVSYLSQLLQW
jgi:hypothetical protein